MSKTVVATVDRYNFAHSRPMSREHPEVTRERLALQGHIKDNLERFRVAAREVLAWVASDDFGGTGEYVENLKRVASGQTVDARNVALLVSAIGSYRRWQGKVAERAARAETAATSEWQGAVGDKKHEVVGTVTGVRLIEGDYGTTTLYTFTTAEGHIYKWFSSNSRGWVEGDAVHIAGTIKAHDEFRGTKQTVLTRCKEV